MKIKAALDLAQITTFEQFRRYVSDVIRQIVDLCNGGISFSENFDATITTYTFAAANTEYGIGHSLGRAPNGYIITKRSANMVVYDGSTANTDSVIYLKASAGGTVSLIIF